MTDNQSVQVARTILGLSWIYQGLFPKLFTVAPLEQAMTATVGLSEPLSYSLTKTAGVLEVLMGLALLHYYRSSKLIIANIIILLALCGFVALQLPVLLVEAFNPVTTNIPLIGLSFILLRAQKS